MTTGKRTYEELRGELKTVRVQNLDLRQQLEKCHDNRNADAAQVRAAAKTLTQARAFADAYHANPWAHSTVFKAGVDLINAVREIPGGGIQRGKRTA